MKNLFVGIASQDTAVEMSGQLNVLAVALMKIANDLRWMNSGPIGGLKEKTMGALRGKVFTVIIPEKNRKDLMEIPANVKRKLKFVIVRHMDEIGRASCRERV